MEAKRGGTKLHCPSCDETTVCAALPYSGGEQLEYSEAIDLWSFARDRECQSCGYLFETVEVDRSWLRSVEWRIRMVQIDEQEVFEKAHGATQTILNWNMDLKLQIEAIEKNLNSLRSLGERIDKSASENQFLKRSRG